MTLLMYIAVPAIFGATVWGCTWMLLKQTRRDADRWLNRRNHAEIKIQPKPVRPRMKTAKVAASNQ